MLRSCQGDVLQYSSETVDVVQALGCGMLIQRSSQAQEQGYTEYNIGRKSML